MENLVFTQLSIPEIRQLFRQELETYFTGQNKSSPNQHDREILLNIQQVAAMLSLSVPTIYGLVSRSEIPCMKKGKRLYFSKEEITNWVKTGKRKTLSEIDSETDNFLIKKKKGGSK